MDGLDLPFIPELLRIRRTSTKKLRYGIAATTLAQNITPKRMALQDNLTFVNAFVQHSLAALNDFMRLFAVDSLAPDLSFPPTEMGPVIKWNT